MQFSKRTSLQCYLLISIQIWLLGSTACLSPISSSSKNNVPSDQIQDTRSEELSQSLSTTNDEYAGYEISVGKYTNLEYGYEIEIPKNHVGYRSEAPSPNNGVMIKSSLTPDTRIGVFSIRNALFIENLNQYSEYILRRFSYEKTITGLTVLHRKKTTLGKLPAIRLLVSYTKEPNQQVFYKEYVIAMTNEDDLIDRICFEVSILTPKETYQNEVPLFERVLQSWKNLNRQELKSSDQ